MCIRDRSFAEKELPPGGREKVMASFERVLMPGLEKNQYSILWVEHPVSYTHLDVYKRQGLYAAAERMGERLRGIAENVFAYATGQRDADRASDAVESAGAALERADSCLLYTSRCV